MERSTTAFWVLVIGLLSAAAVFGVGAYRLKSANQSRDAVLGSGDLVTLQTVLDGDTVVVSKEGQGNATIRILGIKSFESKHGKDDAAFHGRAAEEALKRLAGDAPLRVWLNNPPKDKNGRTLAVLLRGGDDLGLSMVREGHALVYTVYPFPNMTDYLAAQQHARAARIGVWADPAMAERAELLIREWARQGA